MKTLFPVLIAFLLQAASVFGQEQTAYSALRVVGKAQGDEALSHVLELRGRFGDPEPDVWKVLIDEPSARGGVREFEVQRGRVIGERTPSARDGGRPLNLNRLNLDSEGAFTVADKAASQAQVPFDRIDYVLQSGPSGAPVWTLELFEGRNGRVGALEISADTGNIIRREWTERRRTERTPPPRRDYDDDDDDRRYVERERRDRPSNAEREVSAFFGRVGRHFERRGHQFKNFFQGNGFEDERERRRERDYDRDRDYARDREYTR